MTDHHAGHKNRSEHADQGRDDEPARLHKHGQAGSLTDSTEPPAEPGYPEHPEIPHPPGHLPGSTTGAESPTEHGHMAHGAHAGPGDHHDKHAGHSPEMFRDRFWLSLLLAIPTLIWSELFQGWFNYTIPEFPGSSYIPLIFGVAVFIYGGRVFLQGAVHELKDRLPGMMTLISLAIVVALVYSLAVTFGFPGMALWWEIATLITIMLLGHWMEMRSIAQASGALNALARLLPATAARVVDGRTEEVPIAELRAGDVVLVRPGASIPTDGEVREGRSAVNESMITGESAPVDKDVGSEVIGGTVNGTGSLRIEVTKTGEKTALAGIMRLVSEAQSSRSRSQALADRAAFILTLVAIGAGALTAVIWAILGAPGAFTVERVVTVLVIACPHALGLAIPLVVAISTTLGARNGLLIRHRRGLEEARNLDAVVFDKTGTLTLGEFRVVEITTGASHDTRPGAGDDEQAGEGAGHHGREARQALPLTETEALRLAGAVEHDSEHAIAQGIVKSAEERGISLPEAQEFEAIPGHGVRAVVEGREFRMGGPALLRKLGIVLPPVLEMAVERAGTRGQAAVALLEGQVPLAIFAVADQIRPESYEAVRRLHDNEIEVVMLTGDAWPVARAVAAELGIDTVFAEVLPEQKVDKIKELQAQGKRVAMVGDGVNDAPALLTADVGLAIGAGTDVAVEAGDVVLVRSDPRDMPRIVELSKATYRKMVQNLWWAAGYNIVAIPLAAGVLAGVGILLPVALGAVLMSLSTIIVALNSQLLRRVRL